MSHACLHAAGSALPCLGQAFPVLHASRHRALTDGCAGGCRTCFKAVSIDRAEFFALGWLVWLGCTAWRRWEFMVACWRCRLITAVSCSASIIWLISSTFNEWLNVENWPCTVYGG